MRRYRFGRIAAVAAVGFVAAVLVAAVVAWVSRDARFLVPAITRQSDGRLRLDAWYYLLPLVVAGVVQGWALWHVLRGRPVGERAELRWDARLLRVALFASLGLELLPSSLGVPVDPVQLILVPASDHTPGPLTEASACEPNSDPFGSFEPQPPMTAEKRFVCEVRISKSLPLAQGIPDGLLIAYGHRLCAVYTRDDPRELARLRETDGVDFGYGLTADLAEICPPAAATVRTATTSSITAPEHPPDLVSRPPRSPPTPPRRSGANEGPARLHSSPGSGPA
jgi:hypothetical protein